MCLTKHIRSLSAKAATAAYAIPFGTTRIKNKKLIEEDLKKLAIIFSGELDKIAKRVSANKKTIGEQLGQKI